MTQARLLPVCSWLGHRVILPHALIALLTIGLASCGTPGTPEQKLATDLGYDLHQYLIARASAEHISTLSLTVNFRGGAPPVDVSTGTAQYASGAAVIPADVFQIGSNTKAYTAVAILQLEAAGLLSINDNLGKWLPQYPAWSSVTIKQLLNMTSTIPTYDLTQQWADDYGANPLIESTPGQLINYVYPTISAPGTGWLYSNTGYILLQLIIDKASPTQSYQTDIDNLLAQNNLQNTFYQPYFYPQSVTSRLVSGYYANNVDPPVLTNLLGTDTSTYSLGLAQAAGGMVATPEDFTIWVRDLFEGNVLPSQQLQEFESLVSTTTGQPISDVSAQNPAGFGLGIFKYDDPNLGTFWGYQGATLGYRATYMYFPNNGLIVCVFTNSTTAPDQNQIIPVLFPKLIATLKADGRD